MYSKKIMDHFATPDHVGGMRGADMVGKFESEDVADIVKIYIKLDENGETIENAQFKTFGSPATIACSDVACEILIGKTVEEAEALSNADIISVIGDLPLEKIASSTNVISAVHNAVEEYKKKMLKEAKKKKK